jgi:hypothetical protein
VDPPSVPFQRGRYASWDNGQLATYASRAAAQADIDKGASGPFSRYFPK